MINAVVSHHSESSHVRVDLGAALDKLFKDSTLIDQQQTQSLVLCTKYRSVFALSPSESSKCTTIADAEFPSQRQAKYVDHKPYRSNPRAQEVIDKCAKSMELMASSKKA